MFKLVKEIKSQSGVLHFRRYLVLATPWFNCYLHYIYQGDKDKHLHSHPWQFWGIILKGSYIEQNESGTSLRKVGSFRGGDLNYFHKILEVKQPVISLFFTGIQEYPWGYKTSQGIINHEQYRELKNSNQLPE